tara:strand:+ start:389 stop:601 length:213 start_codon:yes stop_codon:yes gene_type:complete
MNYSSLGKYYDDLFLMQYKHGFAISELMRLVPFERDLMMTKVNDTIAAENETQRLNSIQEESIRNARSRK